MSILQTGLVPSTGGYQIERSLRFNSADSAYLNRTSTSDGNRKVWTWSGWVKRSYLGANAQYLFGCQSQSGNDGIATIYFSSDQLHTYYDTSGANPYGPVTTAVYRDPSAWYHIVWAVNAASTIHYIYVNGVLLSANSSYYPPNYDYAMNRSGYSQKIGVNAWDTPADFASLYMTEVNFVDGQVLAASDFGETDSVTGIWKPKKYAGTYGTNGFYLKFADNSGTTSTTLGKDSSGNGNNWTPNGFVITAGTGNDSLVDTPTNYGTDTGAGGEVRGNYGTWNPLNKIASGTTLSNGNLTVAQTTDFSSVTGTVGVSSGKYYVEYTFSGSTVYGEFGFNDGTLPPYANTTPRGTNYVVYGSFASISSKAYRWTGGSSSTATNYITNTSVLGIAIDCDAGKVWFSIGGVFQDSGNPATGANPNGTFTAGATMFPFFNNGTSITVDLNCGQRPFANSAPSGYKALCTQNLPEPTVKKGSQYFDVQTYTGNGTNGRVITTNLNEVGLAWVKIRSGVDDHRLANIVTGGNKHLKSNNTDAESTATTVIQSFSGSTFTIGTDNSVNVNGSTYVAWAWAASGSGVTNNSGTITSTVSANTTAGFSIVTYTGNGSANATVGHGLGVAPAFGILKDRDTNSNNNQWHVFATAYGDYYGYLSAINAFAATAEFYPTSGSSTTVTIGRSSPVANSNESGDRYVMYLFAPVAGYSAFGKYTGNGSTDGPFVYCGFRPRYLILKRSSTASVTYGWQIYDTARSTFNTSTLPGFWADTSAAEAANTYGIDLVSNGFKLRSDGVNQNGNGDTYIYAAFAENPFKYSLAR